MSCNSMYANMLHAQLFTVKHYLGFASANRHVHEGIHAGAAVAPRLKDTVRDHCIYSPRQLCK